MSLAAFQIALSFLSPNYARYGIVVHEAALSGLSGLFLALAILAAAVPSLREPALRHLDGLSSAKPRVHALWIALAYMGIVSWLGFVKYCHFRRYLLVNDTAFSINLAHNFIHFGTLEHTMYGAHALSIHFMLFMPVISPFLLLCDHPFTLIFIQHALLCSIPIAVYILIFLRTRSSLAGLCGLLLMIGNPYFHDLIGGNLHINFLAAFLPWAMVFFDLKRWIPFAVCMALMLCSYEVAAFSLAGLGFYLALGRRKWALGLAVVAAAVVVFLAELSFVRHFESREPMAIGPLSRYSMFAHLAPPGTPLERVLGEVAGSPLKLLGHLLSSPYIYFPVLRVLFFAGFFPLFSAAQLPFWAAALPHLLGSRGTRMALLDHVPTTFYDFGGHNGAYMFGPLAWATALGLSAALARWPGRGGRGALLAAALGFAGLGLRYTRIPTHPHFMPHWFEAMPRVLAQVPREARVWADDNVTPHLANRRWLRVISFAPGEDVLVGHQKLFAPDYVLIDKAWLDFAERGPRDVLLTYWARNGFRKAVENGDILLLRSPATNPRPEDVPEWIRLPKADAGLARSFAQYLLSTKP